MTDHVAWRRALRAVAIAIALAAAVDPAVTTMRPVRPVVSVVAAEPARDGALAARVAAELAGAFTVLPAPFADAAAVVVVGERVPPDAVRASLPDSAPVFAVLPDAGAALRIAGLEAPRHVPLASRVEVVALLDATAARGREVEVRLSHEGALADRVVVEAATDGLRVPLRYVPTAAGPAHLRVEAAVAGGRAPTDSARADLVVEVRDARWQVLVFDRRPSWQSTFVRRALARDPRLVVTSRTETSPAASAEAGRAPEGLDDLARTMRFDAIVVGAPEALTARDVDGLARWLRRRGGGALLLFDRDTAGPADRLLGTSGWRTSRERAPLPVSLPGLLPDSAALRATLVRRPARLPVGAEPLGAGRTADVVWERPVGAGRLVVNGALDAWRWRDPSRSAFDEAWSALVADLAAGAAPPLAVELASPVLPPGGETTVQVTLRDLALGGDVEGEAARAGRGGAASVAVAAALEGPAGAIVPVRLLPDGAPGTLRGRLRAPGVPGTWRLVVRADTGGSAQAAAAAASAATSPSRAASEGAEALSAAVPVVVADGATDAVPAERALLSAWAASRVGDALPSARVAELPSGMARALRPGPRPVTWHPMRSPWWILPFALALAGEWWLRRRRGLS